MWGFYPLPAGIGGIVIILMILAFPQVGIGLLIAGIAILLMEAGLGLVSSVIIALLLFFAAITIYCIHREKAGEQNNIAASNPLQYSASPDKCEVREKLRALEEEFSDVRDFDFSTESDRAIKAGTLEALEDVDKRAGRYAEWKRRHDKLQAELQGNL